MATYTNTIIIKSDKFTKASELITLLNLSDLPIDKTTIRIADEGVSYYDSLNDLGIAVGFWKNFILLTGYRITDFIYDSVTKRNSSGLRKINDNFPEFDALLLYSNDTEMSFVFELIKGGVSLRRKLVYHEKLVKQDDYGDLLQSELESYRAMGYAITDVIKNSNEYVSGYDDINISLALINEFCGQMPDFDNLKMNVGIEEDLGQGYIQNINSDFGDEKSKIKRVINCINESFFNKTYRLKKHKDFPKDKYKSNDWHQPGQILHHTESHQIAFIPLILCSFRTSIEVKIDFKQHSSYFKDSDRLEDICFRGYIEDGISTKKEFEALLGDLHNQIVRSFLPILSSTNLDISTLIVENFYNEEYFRMIINAAEKGLRRSSRSYPLLYQFDDLLIIDGLRERLNMPRNEKLCQYFTGYLVQYEQVILNQTVSHSDFLREKFASLIMRFS